MRILTVHRDKDNKCFFTISLVNVFFIYLITGFFFPTYSSLLEGWKGYSYNYVTGAVAHFSDIYYEFIGYYCSLINLVSVQTVGIIFDIIN